MYGDVETFLGAGKNGFGQSASHELAQNYFEMGAADFQVLGQTRGELDYSMIQKGWTHFEGMGHAHAVALIENVVLQIIVLVEPEEAVEVTFALAGELERGSLAFACGTVQ